MRKTDEIAWKCAVESPAVDPVSEASASVEFGRFRILPHRREVLADDRPVELGGRAFDILMALIEANGSVVSKDELISRVWPGRVVEEGILRAQIRALRTALRDPDLIRTVAGQGYQFTGEVRRSAVHRQGSSNQEGADAAATAAPRLSIVVLPFVNLSDDREQQYFADGITEDLTTDLSRLVGYSIISRNTASSRAIPRLPIGTVLLTQSRSAASSECAMCSRGASGDPAIGCE
jgi:DNA-binding winged helix-turn-helix (wHTH) protein